MKTINLNIDMLAEDYDVLLDILDTYIKNKKEMAYLNPNITKSQRDYIVQNANYVRTNIYNKLLIEE